MFVNDLFEKKETKQRLDPKCWTGYKKQGTKIKDGVRVNNCVPANESSDISGLLAASKLNKSFIVTAKTAEGATKKYRVKAQSERVAREKFSKHFAMAEILSVKEEGVNEFAPPSGDGGDDGFSDETLKRMAAQWWQGDEDPRIEKTLAAAGWEIGQDEGYDNGGVFVVQAGDVNGNSYMSWPAEELEGLSEANPGISKDAETKFHAKLDQLVHDTFGKRDSEKGMAEGAASHSELARLAHEAYITAVRSGNAVMANHYKQAYEKHKRLAAVERKRIAKGVAEAGPFSYGAKKPRKGSVADLAAKKRKEQEKNKKPIEPKDQMVGVAKVIKDVAEGETPESELERLKLRQNAEHSRAPLQRQAATQARIRELEKQVNDKKSGVAEGEKKGLYYYVNKRKKAGTSRPAGHPKAPTAQAWKDAAKTAKKEDVNKDYDLEVRLMEMRLAGYAV